MYGKEGIVIKDMSTEYLNAVKIEFDNGIILYVDKKDIIREFNKKYPEVDLEVLSD